MFVSRAIVDENTDKQVIYEFETKNGVTRPVRFKDSEGDHEIKRKLARKEYKMDWSHHLHLHHLYLLPQVNKPFTFPRILTFKFKFE
ncbi:hypothetical protein TVAG_024870 [Trichomonas vaginalis G3]|uniref:Uncharacterized protein n=1 Tax=Trichomonas vaginalis (strain ATCC PRA-98 / G3) TaxID=412133 RepID=A2GRU3_TRIV3|nr:hypothetical protein TVAGG3_0286260 [Trichomonas vaginalis G3]EAX80124.1 hypothetical protein TVAG_024870 [Trichomonas vaginalis G3]KAI5526920.1 hypothetical protein TVAGG3_0286260 [Trichomonas vaginalis G3]|eukprot:XP_001293054.1 hypothetical protein [Trichomonas vaginalis G3]